MHYLLGLCLLMFVVFLNKIYLIFNLDESLSECYRHMYGYFSSKWCFFRNSWCLWC